MDKPTIGRIVTYRSRTGDYDLPAIVNCTTETLSPKGVEAGHVPDLSGDMCVHLTVFTPGKPGTARDQAFEVESPHGRGVNVAGCYQEWDVMPSRDPATPDAGSWRWPERR